MNEFDDHDLARRLRAAAGSDPDLAAAQHAIGERVRRARRRRTAAVSGCAAIVLLAFVAAVAMRPESDSPRLHTADQTVVATAPDLSTTVVPPASTHPSSSVATTSTTTTTMAVAQSTTTDPTTATSIATTSTEAAAPPAAPTLPPSSTTSPRKPIPTSTTSTTLPTTAPTTPPTTAGAPPVDATQVFSEAGGSITVQMSGGRMRLIGWTPAPGYSFGEKSTGPDEIEVKFVSATDESIVRVRLVSGQMQQRSAAHSESIDDGAPQPADD